MINKSEKFECPVHRSELRWPDAFCPRCNKPYLLSEVDSQQLGRMKIYDFRQEDADIALDRADLEAHLKVIEGLFYFETKKLQELGFDYAIEKISFRRRIGRSKVYLKYLAAVAGNYLNLLKHWASGGYSLKRAGSDSVQSSLLGYSKTYEMISSFVVPNWLGFLDERLALDGAINHHYDNMRALQQIAKEWNCRDVLEFGVGSGINLLLLSKFMAEKNELILSGFDYPVARLLTARATMMKHGVECQDLFLANGLNLPLKANSYDLVFSHYVIEQMKGFEEQALDNMIRVARKGVVLFETALWRPTWDQTVYMQHSGYSRDLPQAVRQRNDIEIVKIENNKRSRFYGCPNVLFVLRKK